MVHVCYWYQFYGFRTIRKFNLFSSHSYFSVDTVHKRKVTSYKCLLIPAKHSLQILMGSTYLHWNCNFHFGVVPLTKVLWIFGQLGPQLQSALWLQRAKIFMDAANLLSREYLYCTHTVCYSYECLHMHIKKI